MLAAFFITLPFKSISLVLLQPMYSQHFLTAAFLQSVNKLVKYLGSNFCTGYQYLNFCFFKTVFKQVCQMEFEIMDQTDDWLTLAKEGIGVELKGNLFTEIN